MILTDQRILQEIANGNIVINPFKHESLGTNSYDVHLGKYLAVYKNRILDARTENEIVEFEIPEDGYELQPNTLYLGVTLAVFRREIEDWPFGHTYSCNCRQRRCWVLQPLDT